MDRYRNRVFAVLFTRIRDVKDMYSKLYSKLKKLNSTITMRRMFKVFLGSIVVLITALPIILNASALGSVTNSDTWNSLASYTLTALDTPVISIISPEEGDVFDTSNITVSGNVSGYTGQVNVTVKVGGVIKGMTVTGGPTGTWTSSPIQLEVGSNSITAIAIDTSYNSAETQVNVIFTRPSDNGSVGGGGGYIILITSPKEGDVFDTSPITVSGNVSDNISKVEVTVGSVTQEVNITGGTTWTFSSIPLEKGLNKITAKATDTSNNSTETSVNVTYSPVTNSGGGGGGGGGGSGGSGENFSNIDVIEKYDQPIYKDIITSYKFINPKNPIIFVNITGNVNYDGVTTMVEALKGPSTIVKSAAMGNVYMNVNIWVGTSGFATPKNIKEAVIRFRVENSWIGDLSNGDIKLLRWDGSNWVTLETSEISKDSTFTYFEANTDSFSPFAITSLKEKSALNGVMFSQEKTSTEKAKKSDGNKAKGNQPESNKPDVLMNWFIISGIFVLIGLIIEVLRIKKK